MPSELDKSVGSLSTRSVEQLSSSPAADKQGEFTDNESEDPNWTGNGAPECSDYKCSVCLELYCKPRTCFPCLHAFCEPCLRSLVHWQGTQYVSCPTCRTPINFTQPNCELEKLLEDSGLYKERCDWYLKSDLSWKKYSLPGYGFQRLLPGRLRGLGSALNAMWISVLCLVFFFLLFVPGVYISSFVLECFHSLTIHNFSSFDMSRFLDPVKSWADFSELMYFLLGSGIVTAAGIAAASALVMYLVFML